MCLLADAIRHDDVDMILARLWITINFEGVSLNGRKRGQMHCFVQDRVSAIIADQILREGHFIDNHTCHQIDAHTHR
jgi:hypothetical protein